MFSHLKNNQPHMVDVSDKIFTKRTALAQAILEVSSEIASHFQNNDLLSPKGPVFQTAIVAGVIAAKKCSDLIPMCHPLPIQNVDVKIKLEGNLVVILASVEVEYKTGVEMEALTAVSIAALTVYDMCKSIDKKMVIKEIKLLEKTGGKNG